jgi:cyclophilin family peptidyl-prolyl cis-trans isomerase
MHIRGIARALIALLTAVACGIVQASFIIRFETVLGDFDVWMRDDVAPLTVQNFMNYVERGDYRDSIVHRSESDFVIQGGGYFWDDAIGTFAEVFDDAPLANEYFFGSSPISNSRGTMAMAQLPGNPNSATNEWFINLANNPDLDAFNPFTSSGPYVVFGQVLGNGMDVVDAIAELPIYDGTQIGLPFSGIPLIDLESPTTPIEKRHVVLIESIGVLQEVPDNAIPLAGLSGNYSFLFLLRCVLDAQTSSAPNPSPADAPAGVQFAEGFFTFTLQYVTNPLFGCPELTTPFSTLVDMELPAGNAPNVYYRYGPTPDNPTPHWYDFAYDGRTGARFFGSKVLLAFVDGERGDDDLTVNDVIVDAGGPGVKAGGGSGNGGGGGGGGGGSVDLWLLLSLLVVPMTLTAKPSRQRKSPTVV